MCRPHHEQQCTLFLLPSALHPLGRDWEVAPPRRGARLWKTLVFSIVFRFSGASRAGRPHPDCTSASLPLSMSAKRFSWFSMLAFLPLPLRPWRTLREPFFRPPSAILPPRRSCLLNLTNATANSSLVRTARSESSPHQSARRAHRLKGVKG